MDNSKVLLKLLDMIDVSEGTIKIAIKDLGNGMAKPQTFLQELKIPYKNEHEEIDTSEGGGIIWTGKFNMLIMPELMEQIHEKLLSDDIYKGWSISFHCPNIVYRIPIKYYFNGFFRKMQCIFGNRVTIYKKPKSMNDIEGFIFRGKSHYQYMSNEFRMKILVFMIEDPVYMHFDIRVKIPTIM